MADTIKFKIVLESNGEKMLHNLTINTEDFVDAVKLATTETQKLSNELNAFSKGALVFSSMTSVVEHRQSIVIKCTAKLSQHVSFIKDKKCIKISLWNDIRLSVLITK